ncbi:MAG: TRAP transporter TatT component family protein [Gammaproteobacteria bacterium]|jgi:hypothetical protein
MLTRIRFHRGAVNATGAANRARFVLLCLLSLLIGGCAAGLTRSLPASLSKAILDQDDPETVRAGAPAYLLLLDGLIENDPHDPSLLRSAADLYGAYATVFVNDPKRARRLSTKALHYARSALCVTYPQLCAEKPLPYEKFVSALANVEKKDVPVLYSFGAAWAGWVQTHSDDWKARSDIPKIEAVMERVVKLKNGYQHGRAHLYLGVFRSLLPPAMGGKPKEGRTEFEKAIAISKGRDLIDKVEFARRYARLVYDKKLYNRLLHEVLEADPSAPGLTLSNVIAQQQARRLLAESDKYFGE